MNVGSLFTGIGGLDLAVGGDTVWMCEYDPHCQRVLAERFPGVPVFPDVRELDAGTPPVDVLCGGYPCQPFSVAGKRGGDTDPRHLWPEFARLIRVLQPRVAVLENVAGHLALGFDRVLADLAGLGMDARWGVVRASDVGAPHRRARLFVVATDPRCERWPEGWPEQTRRDGQAIPVGRPGAARDTERAPSNAHGEGRGSRHPTRESGGAAPDPVGERLDGRGGADTGCTRSGGRAQPARHPVSAADTDERPSGPRRRVAGGDPARPDTQAVADTDGAGGEARRDARPDRERTRLQPVGHPASAADPDGTGRERIGTTSRTSAGEETADRVGASPVAWGVYADAVHRWEHIIGRPAPPPTDDRGRLEPGFVEWMMGFPAGWTDGAPRTQRLKMLGNAVVPQQAALALELLCA